LIEEEALDSSARDTYPSQLQAEIATEEDGVDIQGEGI